MAQDLIQLPLDGGGKRLDAYSYVGAGAATVYAQSSVAVSTDGSIVFPPSSTAADAYANPTVSAIRALNYIYNGTSNDRLYSAAAAANSSGTGVLAAGLMVYDGSKFQLAGGYAGDSGQNALIVAGGRAAVPFSTGVAAAVAVTDCSNYRWVSVQITGQGTGSTVTFQASNDNSNWTNIYLRQSGTTSTAFAVSTTAAASFDGPLPYRYFRLNVTGISAGTTAGTVVFTTMPTVTNQVMVSGLNMSTTTPTDGVTGQGGAPTWSQGALFNATNWEKMRSVAGASGTSGAGIVAAGLIAYDNAASLYRGGWMASADALSGQNVLAVSGLLYNGATNDRPRAASGTTGVAAVSPLAATAGGATPYQLISAASTNATNVKNAAGQVYWIVATNQSASARFLKLYDKASAPTVGTDTPVQTYIIPGNASGAGVVLQIPVGMVFASGIALAITGVITVADTTAIGANEVSVSLGYK